MNEDANNDAVQELLLSRMEAKETTQKLTKNISIITEGGVEQLKAIVEHDPEVILAALEGMMALVLKQEESVDQVSEYWLQSLENNDELMSVLRRYQTP